MKNFNEIPDFKLFLERLENNKKLYEMSLHKDKVEQVKRFKISGDYKGALKIINELINILKDSIKELNYDDIRYDRVRDRNIRQIVIHYNPIIRANINDIMECLLEQGDNSDTLSDKIFGNGTHDFNLEIDIHTDNLNNMDVINELPIFMKGLGIGKKIYKKLIKDFGYLSSIGNEPSEESNMVWYSLTEDKELYTFIGDDNIIVFFNDVDYELIIEKLKLFFEGSEKIIVDDDFIEKYKEMLEKSFLKNNI